MVSVFDPLLDYITLGLKVEKLRDAGVGILYLELLPGCPMCSPHLSRNPSADV